MIASAEEAPEFSGSDNTLAGLELRARRYRFDLYSSVHHLACLRLTSYSKVIMRTIDTVPLLLYLACYYWQWRRIYRITINLHSICLHAY